MKKQNDNLKASNPPEEKGKSDIIKRREALKRIATTALAFTGAAFITACTTPYSASVIDGNDADGYSSYSSYNSYASYSSYSSYNSYANYSNYSSYSSYSAYYTAYNNYYNYYYNYYINLG